ncbi:T9SS type A sorting domain-containing protein [Chitinophaga oryzae]|uniref:T9SS type A sorting domain-containing protein n=1 Tax=Chitinophaga oryzae TaxID=2725414 RepID=A0AAE6ZNK8_9BACT|nr:T9SS type A sorting domain-containing protein [Chitinophaga oryzae]QJB35468.1 T9SS type A sorting domain-containing protein [Chitinophaga oryzae]
MKKWLLHLLPATLFVTTVTNGNVYSQTSATATWALTANQQAVTTGNVSANAQQLNGLVHYDYISGGERTIPSSGTWPAQTGADDTRNMLYTVAPAAGSTLTVKEIAASLSFNGSSACRVKLSWSTDSIHFTDVTTDFALVSSSTPTAYTFTGLNINVRNNGRLFFRISPWTTGVVTGKYLITKNVAIKGITATAPVAAWPLTANQQGTATGNISVAAQTLNGLSVAGYSAGQQLSPTGGNWPAESAPAAGRYAQFAVTPTTGNAFTATGISLSLAFGAAGGQARVSWSVNGTDYTTLDTTLSIGATANTYALNTPDITATTGQTLYLRVSPWSSTATTSPLTISEVTVTGYTYIVPAITWALTTDQSPAVSGDVTAAAQTLTGLKVNNYITGNGGQRLLPPDSTWPAATAPDNGRYIQYTAAPVTGNSLTVQQVTVPLSFNSSDYAHARIAWSTDGTSFTDFTADQALTAGATPVAYTFSNLNIDVPTGKTFYLRVYPWTTAAITGKYLVTKNVMISGTTYPFRQIAFPGAEGAGRFAKGGRGGSVYYVTNLNNSGAGSLRDAVSQPNRTVMFKVSGTINLLSAVVITQDNITIAGQTAPGDGICLANYGMGIRANNVIIRYIRSRPGDIILNPNDTAKAVDAMYNNFGSPVTKPFSNIIVDHCSLSWSTDEAGSFYAISNFTLQWSLLSESLYKSKHVKETPHGYGGIWGGQQVSFHHNLLASHSNRNPRFSGSANTGQPELEYVDFRNNVVYNWAGSTYGGAGGHQNMVNNYYKPGPATTGEAGCATANRRHRILMYTTFSVSLAGDTIPGGKFYIKGNYVPGYPCVEETTDTSSNNWTYGVHPDGQPGAEAALATARVNTPFPYAPVTTQTAQDAFTSVTAGVGAILPRRDTVDRRIVRETRTGTATFGDSSYQSAGMGIPSGIIDSQNTVGGWPTLQSSTYPDDTDNDGLPNWWEKMKGGDSTGIAANSLDSDGFTMLEKYLNAIPSPDQQVTFTQASGIRTGGDTVRISFVIDWAKDVFTFGIFRSTDNANFTQIATIPSNINQTHYVLDDPAAPAQTCYYKIGSSRTDGTGSTLYSQTITIGNALMMRQQADKALMQALSSAGISKNNSLTIYPNPVSDRLVVGHPAVKGRGAITLYTVDGQRVKTWTAANGTTETRIGTGELNNGTYVLVMDNGGTRSGKVFIIFK